MVLGPASHQGPAHARGHRVFQYRVNVRITHTPFEIVPLELQLQHRQVLDMDTQQENPRAAFHHIRLAAIAALHLALVERRDRLA